jgi:hypothetical protein
LCLSKIVKKSEKGKAKCTIGYPKHIKLMILVWAKQTFGFFPVEHHYLLIP